MNQSMNEGMNERMKEGKNRTHLFPKKQEILEKKEKRNNKEKSTAWSHEIYTQKEKNK